MAIFAAILSDFDGPKLIWFFIIWILLSSFWRFSKILTELSLEKSSIQIISIFFDDLNIRQPDIYLDTPTTNINKQTTYIVDKLDTLFDTNKAKYVGVFGDVTSTLAAAISTKNKKRRN